MKKNDLEANPLPNCIYVDGFELYVVDSPAENSPANDICTQNVIND